MRPSKPSKSDRSFGPLSRVRRSHPGQDVLRPVSDAVRRRHPSAGYVIACRVGQVDLGGEVNTDFSQSRTSLKYATFTYTRPIQPEILRDFSGDQSSNIQAMQFNEDAFQFEISSNESEGQCANIACILDARETSQSEKTIDSNDEQLLNILDMPVIWEAPSSTDRGA